MKLLFLTFGIIPHRVWQTRDHDQYGNFIARPQGGIKDKA